jgi:sporadic carbohydrate cluster 2OG-Fe(II) oxygenase
MNTQQQYRDLGFCEASFSNISAVERLADICNHYLAAKFNKKIPLSSYHLHCKSDEEHRELHFQLTKLIRKSGLHHEIMTENLAHFQELVGGDIDIQVEPYLRISRPNIFEDNIGMHRDTFYGNTAYEISCVVPLVDFEPGCGVHVLPKSYLLGAIDYEPKAHPEIKKGSKQNAIGFLYSTKKIKNLDMSNLYDPMLKKGDYLMFSLCMIHGQEVNSSNITRWSIDFRFKNSFAPINTNLKSDYYKTFSSSPATDIAKQYYQGNSNEISEMKGAFPLTEEKI